MDSRVDILIGDEHLLFVDLLSSVLTERGYGTVDSVDDQERLVTDVRYRRPRLCLVDHRSLGGRDRGRLLERLRTVAGGRTKIVVVSTGPSGPAADTATTLGVHGVLDKRSSLQVLLDGVRQVLDGGGIPAAPPRSTEGDYADEAAATRRLAESLTPRERECLALLVEGRTTQQIQGALSVSVMTVRSHVRSLLRKLDVHSRLEAASVAVRYELVTDELGSIRVS